MTRGSDHVVLVDGQKLRHLRKARGFGSMESLAAACGSVTYATIRRAEAGARIRHSMLTRIATVLEASITDLIATRVSDGNDEAELLIGKWKGFFIEKTRGKKPYIVEEELEFFVDDGVVRGISHYSTPEVERIEHLPEVTVTNGVVIIKFNVETWTFPAGEGTLILSLSRNNDWMEGFASWHEPDFNRIDTSREIAIRSTAPDYDAFYKSARAIMEDEISVHHLRMFMENGYGFRQAVELVERQ